jgi:hypothetical protein
MRSCIVLACAEGKCLLTPQAEANLEAGQAMMRRKIEEVQAQLTERSNQ